VAENLPIYVGDRLLVRDRPWRVRRHQPLSESLVALELEALDHDEPRSISVVVPPDAVVPLPNEDLQFDPGRLDSLASWTRDHQLLAATLVRETGLLSGARFGRVALETYQLAPAFRLLSKPRPSLLVADDVGLGKTIEAGLAMMELLARRRVNRILIVIPPGLLLQWQEELLEKFGLEFTLIENAAGLSRAQTDLPAGTSPWDALPRVLTSIDFLKKETVRRRALRKRWDLVIVDEAHALAESGTPDNPYRTQRTRLGTTLRDNARGLVLLTATPHNGYPHSFRSLIELVEPASATFHGDLAQVARRVQYAMARRMKTQIKRVRPDGTQEDVFPPRHVAGISVPTQEAERKLLHQVAAYCSRTARAAKDTDEADLVGFAMQIVKKRALSSRAALEKTIENRLVALRKKGEDETAPSRAEIRDLQADLPLDEAAAERTAVRILRSAIPKDERRRKSEVRALNGLRKLLKDLPPRDPKIDALVRHLREVTSRDRTEKVIVFTEYLDTLHAILKALQNEPDLADRTVVLKGGLGGRRRLLIQKKFEEPDIRILLATDAASEGLNLQRCCHRVVHLELPWNPNRLEQRNGRVDRYGQTVSPQIRYLYYPDSPEDDVLHRLIGKIESMQKDRVSTPDILGVLRGAGEIEAGLLALDPEARDVEIEKNRLVKLFEDRTADFVRNVQPLVAAGDTSGDEQRKLLDLLNRAEPLLPDDEQLEALVLAALGPGAQATSDPGLFRIEVSLRYRGPGVTAVYPKVTFRRSLAIKHKADEVDFITPLHPLVQAMAAEARRRLVQVYPGERGLPPRRLAARPAPAGEPASVVFTFLGGVSGGGGLLEEHLIAIRLAPDLTAVGSPEDALRLLESEPPPGEISSVVLANLFEKQFDAMTTRAAELAAEQLRLRAEALKAHRRQQAEVLRQDLEADLADRLREIDEAERRARGLVDDRQYRLFSAEEARAGGLDARRAAARAQADARRDEIAEFERVEEPAAVRPLGGLFLVPSDV
jgi:superfamily II DNA or RNA helicase